MKDELPGKSQSFSSAEIFSNIIDKMESYYEEKLKIEIDKLKIHLGAASIVKIGEVWLSGEIGGGVEISKKNKLYNNC